MAIVLGMNAVFHDPAAALVVDGRIVAAAEEERFTRRKHGKAPVAFSTWELPEQAARWCLASQGLGPSDIDVVGYSYDPALLESSSNDATHDVIGGDGSWEGLRTLFARRAPRFAATALPGLDPARVRHVPHHVAHAASAYLAAPHDRSAVLVLDGRGETGSHLAGQWDGERLRVLAAQQLPHSLGILYEEVTAHLGFRRSSDEYKVMALASYGDASRFLATIRQAVRADGRGGFVVEPLDLERLAPARQPNAHWSAAHADLAAAVQCRLEEVLLALARWLHQKTGETALTMAGGVALNCVANARLAAEGPFTDVWVQPAAGDAGTALGAALYLAHALRDAVEPMDRADLGRGWDDEEIRRCLEEAAVAYERPADIAEAVAAALSGGAVVGWFQGRSEYGPRALGHRSLFVDPRRASNLARMNAIKGREEFRPVAPMVLADRANEIFDGVASSPYMLFVHRVRPEWLDRIPAAVHVDGTARAQTVDPLQEPLVARLLKAFEQRSGVPVLVNTSFNTAGRPMVDHPRDALECFGASPIDLLAIGPFLLRRPPATTTTPIAS
jgi:carbamoyltransferase